MFKLLNKKKNNKGFTLVELVIVVAILAILVGILAPQYTKYVEKSRKSADAANLENLVTVFKTAASDGNDVISTGGYKIAIDKDGTTLSGVAVDGETAAGDDAITTATTEINSFAGENWTGTKLKSKKWGVDEISASIAVKDDGSVTVTYSPTTLKETANQ